MVKRYVRGDEVTARRQRVEQRRHDLGGLVVVLEEVQDAEQDQRNRLAEVKHVAGHRVIEDLAGLLQVRVDVGGAALWRRGQQRPAARYVLAKDLMPPGTRDDEPARRYLTRRAAKSCSCATLATRVPSGA